jgi:multiple sugar transport system permease protein
MPARVALTMGSTGVRSALPRRRISTDQMIGLALVSPGLLIVAGVLLYPVLYNLVISTQAWSFHVPPDERSVSVGLSNYAKLFSSGLFWDAWRVTGGFVVIAAIAEYLVGLGLALVMNSKMRGRGFVRTAFLIPMLLAPIVVGIQWRWVLSGNFGVVYYALGSLGLNVPTFLSDPNWAMPAVILADTWQNAPFVALILLAALQSIPIDVYEAARVDGAVGLRLFRSITLPLIASASLLAVLIRFGDLIRSFDLIFLMTAGGPSRGTQVVSLYTYYLAFSQGELGQAAAVANLVAIVSLIAGWVLVRLVRTQTRIA